MALAITLSPASDVPVYRQIVNQVAHAVVQGRLALGEQLPAVRVLAEKLVVNPNTVARAYQELIRDGLLESRSGIGVFVARRSGGALWSDEERARRLAEAAARLAAEGRLLDFTLPEVRAALEREWKEMGGDK